MHAQQSFSLYKHMLKQEFIGWEGNGPGLIWSQFVFIFSRAQRDLFWIGGKTHAGVYFWLFLEIIHLSLPGASLSWTQMPEPRLCVVYCGAIAADVHKRWIREIQASKEVMELSTMRALRIYCQALPWTEEWAASRERVSFMQWRTMSQEEPRPEPGAECFIYSHPHGHPACGSSAKTQEGWGFQTV